MKIKGIKLAVLTLISIGISCNEPLKEKSNGWSEENQVLKTIENIEFTFPSEGYSFEKKDSLITECLEAIKNNSELINISNFKDTLYIRFLSNRDEMKKYTGSKSAGYAKPWINTVYIMASGKPGEVKAPIKHELMHMVSLMRWEYPPQNLTWMVEGLATYAENNCNGYNVQQIYRYLLENKMLLPIDSIASSFYDKPEMIAYHESAYIVEYLITNYGMEKFKKLWKEGFDNFEKIYLLPIEQVMAEIEKKLIEKYPKIPDINWEVFKEGCK
jgi:Peptidase MA superfamily